MLIDPASKVSVPLTVVMRMRSSVPPRAMLPDDVPVIVAAVAKVVELAIVQRLLPSVQIVMTPPIVSAADAESESNKPAVEFTPVKVFDALAAETYPDVEIEPDPICTILILVPFVLTPFIITVILLTQLGILVKSMDVPDVDACAVADVSTLDAIVVITALDIAGAVNVLFVSVSVVAFPTKVSVLAGRVITVVTASVGDRVVLPDVAPAKTTVPIYYPLQNYPTRT